jgi:uncharacterized protein (TIGR03382 family)
MIAAVLAAAGLMAPSVADACSYSGEYIRFETDPEGEVSVEPGKPNLEVVSVHRDQPKWEPFSGPCSLQGSSIQLEVTPYLEGTGPEDRPVGYIFRVEEGETPDGLDFPSYPVRFHGTRVLFFWPARKRRHQDGFDFTLTVTPIAKNGEPGPTSDPVRVRRGDAGGCSTTGQGSAPGAAWLLVLGGLVLVWRRG